VPRDPFEAMQKLSHEITNGTKLSSQELLLYQMRVGEYGMQVELVSKVAESMNASLRKLQNQG
jgi:hypothetical protein